MYQEAAQHILDALVLQDIDASAEGGDSSGISSSSLWDSLRSTCLHLQRNDLVTLCEKRDLYSKFYSYRFSDLWRLDWIGLE